VRRLEHWAGFLPGRSACATLDGAAGMAASLLREFPAEVESHTIRSCASCAATDFLSPAAPFTRAPVEAAP
jgi:NADH-ubiquinone oxidoreductase subunit F-like iron-sulfur protein